MPPKRTSLRDMWRAKLRWRSTGGGYPTAYAQNHDPTPEAALGHVGWALGDALDALDEFLAERLKDPECKHQAISTRDLTPAQMDEDLVRCDRCDQAVPAATTPFPDFYERYANVREKKT